MLQLNLFLFFLFFIFLQFAIQLGNQILFLFFLFLLLFFVFRINFVLKLLDDGLVTSLDHTGKFNDWANHDFSDKADGNTKSETNDEKSKEEHSELIVTKVLLDKVVDCVDQNDFTEVDILHRNHDHVKFIWASRLSKFKGVCILPNFVRSVFCFETFGEETVPSF